MGQRQDAALGRALTVAERPKSGIELESGINRFGLTKSGVVITEAFTSEQNMLRFLRMHQNF